MRCKINILVATGILLCGGQAFAQAARPVVFTPELLVEQIKLYHPVAKQAAIMVDKARAELLTAKGAFDPVINADASRKTFDGKNYYYYSGSELKLPTPLGINIKTGIENNGGSYITPEATKGRASYAGVEIPLAKGLLMDDRRAALQQARILRSLSEQERLTVLNELMYNAYKDYWQWVGAYQLHRIYARFVSIAENRLRLVRIAYTNGDRAMIDTIEAFAQVQNYKLQESDALLQLNNASVQLSNYLWYDSAVPYQIPLHYVPDTVKFAALLAPASLDVLVQQGVTQNPGIRSYEYKLNSLDAERRLKFQSLLPSFNVKANLLNKNYYALKGVDAAFLQNNYKWGIDFKLPIFLREGRGKYLQTQLKIKETRLELAGKRWETENKIRSYYNENMSLKQQLQTMQSIYNNYATLLRNEELKFSQGESSLFLINSRETKVLESLQKQIELRVKYLKSLYSIEWAAGLLGY